MQLPAGDGGSDALGRRRLDAQRYPAPHRRTPTTPWPPVVHVRPRGSVVDASPQACPAPTPTAAVLAVPRPSRAPRPTCSAAATDRRRTPPQAPRTCGPTAPRPSPPAGPGAAHQMRPVRGPARIGHIKIHRERRVRAQEASTGPHRAQPPDAGQAPRRVTTAARSSATWRASASVVPPPSHAPVARCRSGARAPGRAPPGSPAPAPRGPPARRADQGRRSGQTHVPQHLGQPGHHCRPGRPAGARPDHQVEPPTARQHPIAGRGPAGKITWPALLATEGVVAVLQRLDHVPVANPLFHHRTRARSAMASGTRGCSSPSRPRCVAQPRPAGAGPPRTWPSLVAVHERPRLDGQTRRRRRRTPARLGTVRDRRRRPRLGMGRAEPSLMFMPSGASQMTVTSAPRRRTTPASADAPRWRSRAPPAARRACAPRARPRARPP